MTDYITNYYFYCKLRERTPIFYWGKIHQDRTAFILRYIALCTYICLLPPQLEPWGYLLTPRRWEWSRLGWGRLKLHQTRPCYRRTSTESTQACGSEKGLFYYCTFDSDSKLAPHSRFIETLIKWIEHVFLAVQKTFVGWVWHSSFSSCVVAFLRQVPGLLKGRFDIAMMCGSIAGQYCWWHCVPWWLHFATPNPHSHPHKDLLTTGPWLKAFHLTLCLGKSQNHLWSPIS